MTTEEVGVTYEVRDQASAELIEIRQMMRELRREQGEFTDSTQRMNRAAEGSTSAKGGGVSR
ncbi:MAG: hypothetical protein ACOCV2_13615, partial [Persicimonas sp.]